jgi:hypothetical protein
MSHPYIHAENSVKRYGGKAEDYIEIHHWFDATKAWHPDWRHRSMRHHTEGIKQCVATFGDTLTNSNGVTISIQQIGEEHVLEDLGFIPTPSDWFDNFDKNKWERFRTKKIDGRLTKLGNMTSDKPSSVTEALASL